MAERWAELQSWVAGALRVASVVLEPASADASFRRYFRCRTDGRSCIVMDAPPPEDCVRFVRIAALFTAAGVHVPEVLAQDLERGFLLLSDLGRRSYLHELNDSNADELFADAFAALIRWQSASRPGVLPPYDRAFLRREMELFPEWYAGRHRQVTLTPAERETLSAAFHLLEDSALAQPSVFVHRDYMPRNLILSTPNPGVLDFQDAVYGPITYDVAALFKDAYLSWDEQRIRVWRRRYWQAARAAGLPLPELAEFRRACDWMGMQRHLKVLGLFARLHYRDGKRGYLEDTPRFLNYLREAGRQYREFAPLLKVLDAVESRASDAMAAT